MRKPEQKKLKIDPDVAKAMEGQINSFIKQNTKWYNYIKKWRIRRSLVLDGMKAAAELTEKRRKKIRNLGRNSPCPCGSGRKFKQCCLKRAIN